MKMLLTVSRTEENIVIRTDFLTADAAWARTIIILDDGVFRDLGGIELR
jgi:hypothetical protein